MRLRIVAVGRARRGPEVELFELYRKRLSWPLELVEVEEKRPLAVAQRIASEADLLRAKLPEGAPVVALDERGADLTSRALADNLGQWRDTGRPEIAFLIGGADGLAPELRDQADLTLRFGRVTWPHMLVRAMLAEQLYRAQQILSGHPYHRG
jgi:23S rRNA (pseudouridine1915-N3)-methyltransferase